MFNKIIKGKKLEGAVLPPPSKSMLHRYIISASLAKGVSKIRNINFSDDIVATIEGMKKFGASIEFKEDINSNYLEIDGTNTFNENFLNNNSIIDCKESGSTLRFLLPLALIKKNIISFKGEGKLFTRPLKPYFENFDKYGIKYFYENENQLFLDGELKAGTYEIDGNISSQFITGLLFSLPLLQSSSKILLRGKLESSSYIDMTLDCLKKFGIEIKNKNYSEFIIEGNQTFKSADLTVEADFSQAAFFLVANATGSKIDIQGLNENSLQGDKKIIDFINLIDNAQYGKRLIIDGSETPDIIPILSLKAAMKNVETEIVNLSRLRIKESDRLSATVCELKKMGFDIKEKKDSILINSRYEENSVINTLYGDDMINLSEPVAVSSHADHRIAMLLAIASTCFDGEILLDNLDCVKKSYPNFWEVFTNLGGKIYEHLGK